MKNVKLFLVLAVAVLLGACAKENKVIEFPLVGAANTKMIVFENFTPHCTSIISDWRK